jgi:hypothetical protein
MGKYLIRAVQYASSKESAKRSCAHAALRHRVATTATVSSLAAECAAPKIWLARSLIFKFHRTLSSCFQAAGGILDTHPGVDAILISPQPQLRRYLDD